SNETIEERYSINLEVDSEFMALLSQAKGTLDEVRNSEVLKRALKAYVQKKAPRARKVVRVAKKSSTVRSRYIPVATRDRVTLRDSHRCTYVSPDGLRCTATSGVEVDHVVPFARGGSNEESNLRLLCRAHNQLMAEREFGRKTIQACRKLIA